MTTLQNDSICILIVDGNRESCNSLIDVLRPEGFECVIAADAPSAAHFVTKRIPNLVIANTNLKNISSADFCRSIRVLHPGTEIPVLLVSDESRPNLVEESREAGGFFFLSRPFNPSVLLELVDNALWMPHLVRRHIDTQGHQLRPMSNQLKQKHQSPSM